MNSPPFKKSKALLAFGLAGVGSVRYSGYLTAKTRSKDDLPAFCNPIIVTSISVALDSQRQKSGREIDGVEHSWFARSEGIYSPELPEQPVVNSSEDTGHGEGMTAITLETTRCVSV